MIDFAQYQSSMSDYISEKIEQYERKLKQAEKAGKHNNDDDEEKQDPSQRTGTTIDVASLADRSPHTAAADAPMSMVFSLFSKLQLRCVVVIASNGTAAGDWPASKSLLLTPSTRQ